MGIAKFGGGLALGGSTTADGMASLALFKAKPIASIDTNVLIDSQQQGTQVLKQTLSQGNFRPSVSPQAAKEFLEKNSSSALRGIIKYIGGKMGPHADGSQVKLILNVRPSLGNDARVASYAMKENATVLTNDKGFGNFLKSISYPTQKVP